MQVRFDGRLEGRDANSQQGDELNQKAVDFWSGDSGAECRGQPLRELSLDVCKLLFDGPGVLGAGCIKFMVVTDGGRVPDGRWIGAVTALLNLED